MLPHRQDVELLPAVGPVAVPHQPELLENVERAIDRRRDRGGVATAASIHQVGGRDMAVGLRENLDDGPTLRRPAQATAPQSVGDSVPRCWK